MRKHLKLVLLIATLVGAGLAWAFLPLDEWLVHLASSLRAAGPLGALGYFGAYVLLSLALVPGSLLTLAAGFAYGPLLGTLIVLVSATAAATASFVVGRFLARDWVAKKVGKDPRFAAIDRAVQRRGFRVVFLLRLSPLFPFNLLNYGLGLTRIGLRDYVVASFFGMLPGTALYVYLGSLITDLSQLSRGTRPDGGLVQNLVFYGGLVATVVVTVVVTRIAREALAEDLAPELPTPALTSDLPVEAEAQ